MSATDPEMPVDVLRLATRISRLRDLDLREPGPVIDARLRQWRGFADFCAEQLRVVDPLRQLVPLRLNWLQRQIVLAEVRARRARRAPWFLILKYRKGGVTTLEQALAYWTIWAAPHQECLTLAHRPQDMRVIFRMVERFYEHQPPACRHPKTEAVVNWIEFPEWDGLYMAGSAGATATGRGTTLSRVHLSEVAYYGNLAEIHTSLAKSVGPLSSYVMETTPNGRDGRGEAFFDFWQAAKRQDSKFIPLFFPWHHDPHNRLRVTDLDELLPLSEEEIQLQRRFELDLEQVNWWRSERRAIIADGGSADRVHQEHPSDDESCFLLGLEGYYDRAALAELESRCVPPQRVEDNGRLRIWEDAQPANSYVIGVDPAGGTGGDDAACVCFNATTGRQAFSYTCNRVAPDELGQVVLGDRQAGLGWRWANPRSGQPAFIVVERDNHGHACLTGLLKLADYPRDQTYHHIEPTSDPDEARRAKIPGWPHTIVGHSELAAAIGRLLRERSPVIRDADVVRSIGRVGIGPTGAEFGGRDLAVAAGLAALALPSGRDPGPTFMYIGGRIVEI